MKHEFQKGFTLIEIIVVLVIVSILATMGLTQYTKVTEKGRAAEARSILGALRTAEVAYQLEFGSYTTNIGDLAVGANTACDTDHYFSYSSPSSGNLRATRCTTGGKTPNFSGTAYTIDLAVASGTFTSSAGY